jgi:Uma2 family endonuclease
MQVEATKKRFTVDEYYRMAEVGILSENDRTELIEGEILQMSPIGGPHMNAVNRATMIFARGIGDRVVVSVQNPSHMDRYNEPQPDVVLFRESLRPDRLEMWIYRFTQYGTGACHCG